MGTVVNGQAVPPADTVPTGQTDEPTAAELAAATRLPVITGGLVVHPGDTLILTADNYISDAALASMRAQVDEFAPGLKLAVFDGVTVAGAYRPDPA